MKRTLAILLAAIMVLGTLPVLTLGSTASSDAYDYTATDRYGNDWTDLLSDGSYDDYLDEHTWYDIPSGYYDPIDPSYVWTVEQGRLIIAGTGSVHAGTNPSANSYPWAKLSSEITEVIVFPNTVTAIDDYAFASLSNVKYVEIGAGVETIGDCVLASGANGVVVSVPNTITSVGDAVLEGCTNVTMILNNATLEQFLTYTAIGNDNGVLQTANFVENNLGSLAIDAVDAGFDNIGGKTTLSFTLKKNGTAFVVPEGYSWKIQISDGKRYSRESSDYICSVVKMVSVTPDYADGVYSYDICNLEGENQFIPQYECAYIITAALYDENGKLVYTATSDYNEFTMDVEAIYTERTAALSPHSPHGYVLLDLGKAKPVGSLEVAFYQSSSRYYQWVAYGSNDPTLPLSKWTFLGEKINDTISDGSYTVEVEPGESGYGSFRYVRIECTYNSERWTAHFAEVAVYGPPASYVKVPFTATDFYGDDWTAEMTDGSYSDYMGAYGEHTWYDRPSGYAYYPIDPAYVWTVEQGRLLIAGTGAVHTEDNSAQSYPWAKLSDEITEIIVFPGTVSSIDDNAFATLENVKYIEIGAGVETIGNGVFASGADGVVVSVPNTISSIGKGVLNGCTDITIVINNASITDFLTYVSIGADNEELDTAAFVENNLGSLAIDAVDAGFDNIGGKTTLSFTLKKNGTAFVVPEGYTWKVQISDGKRYSREDDDYICSVVKMISIAPDYANGVYSYDICNLEGENQFIPQYECAYIITAALYDENGKLVYTATSDYNEFTMDVEAIYTDRTAAVSPHSVHGYVLLDLGQAYPVGKLSVGFIQSSRYYQWVAYGSNDPTLPLSMWTFLGEKMDHTSSSGSYTVDVQPGEDGYGSFRYIRIECTYNSANWGAHFAEVEVYAISSLCNVTWVIDGVSTTVSTIKGTFPTPEEPIKDPVYGDGYEINYVFLGWSDGTNLYKPGVDLPIVTEDVTYTAVFEEFTERPFLKGDVDGSGFVDISDVTQLLKYLAADEAGKQDLIANGEIATYALDVDTNMAIDISDVTELLKVLAGE